MTHRPLPLVHRDRRTTERWAFWPAVALAVSLLAPLAPAAAQNLPGDAPESRMPATEPDDGIVLPGGELPAPVEVPEQVIPAFDLDAPPVLDGITPAAEIDSLPVETVELVAERNGISVATLEHLAGDEALHLDANGVMLYIDEAPDPAEIEDVEPAALATDLTGAEIALEDAFLLHSKPGSLRTIYLDFDGHNVTGTNWNGGSVPEPYLALPFNRDNDPATFNNIERTAIVNIWRIVAEDFAPFDVNVTTQDPGHDAINRSNAADTTYGTRLVVTDSDPFCVPLCGGIAYLGNFNFFGPSHSAYQPAFCFAHMNFDSASRIAECASHEVGHNLGLGHDGQGGNAYYAGHGAWMPIMGSGTRPVSQWSKGEYPLATNTQDDLAVIAAHGAAQMVDDHGNTTASATMLLTGSDGIIASSADVDAFRFVAPVSGTVSFAVVPAAVSPNLDVDLQLTDAAGNVLASSAPPLVYVDFGAVTGMDAELSYSVTAGAEYYLQVRGGAHLTPADGFSTYGSLGTYSVAVAGPGLDCPGPEANVTNEAQLNVAIRCFNEGLAGAPETVVALGADFTLGRPGFVIDQPNPSSRLRVEGNGHTVDAQGITDLRPFHVAAGTTVAFNDITITGGDAGVGGGILNSGTVTVTRSTITGNTAIAGGGIGNDGGTLTVVDSTVSGNHAVVWGGGIGTGGGTLTLTGSTVSGNTAAEAAGLVNFGNATVTNSTITANTADTAGGGLINDSGAALTLTNVTVSANTAPSRGGIYNQGTLTMANTLVAANTGGDCTGTAAGHHNLIESAAAACGLTNGTDGNLVGVDARLDPAGLADNGGPTLTHIPAGDSPALDAGDNAAATDATGLLSYDQRGVGFQRVRYGTVDIGAVEVLRACPGFPVSVATQVALDTAVGCFNQAGEPGEYHITLAADIALGWSTVTVDNPTAGASLHIDGDGHAIDGLGAFDTRPLDIAAGSVVALESVTITGGRATDGAGIRNHGELSIHAGTVSASNAAAYGGGIYNGPGGVLGISHSTVSGNLSSTGGGGGIANFGALTLVNSTVSGNRTGHILSVGGGIRTSGTAVITNSTISGNTAPDGGGGIANNGSLVLENTLVAGGPSSGDCLGAASGGNNLIQDATLSCGLTDGAGGNVVGHDPLLGPLQDNGGPTLTHAPGTGSPARDAGDDAAALDAGLVTDQRGDGFPRILGTAVDIGALESGPDPDGTAPVVTAAVAGDLGAAGWYVGDVSVSWEVVDEESAIEHTEGCDPVTVDADTTGTTLTCTASSAGGTTTESVTVRRDGTAPEVAVTGVEDGAAYTLDALPEAGCDTTDTTSGVATAATATVTGAGADGTGTLTATCTGATDTAGNTAAAVAVVYTVTPATWTPGGTFDAGDRVTYQGKVYEALWAAGNQVPGISPWGAWQEIAETADGTAIWTDSRVFDSGDVAVRQGATYRAQWWTRNNEPGDPWGPWEEMAQTEDGTAIWKPSRVFDTGDTALHQGVLYRAKWWNRNQPPGEPWGPWEPA